MSGRAWLICDKEGTRITHYQESADGVVSAETALAAFGKEFSGGTDGYRALEVPEEAL